MDKKDVVCLLKRLLLLVLGTSLVTALLVTCGLFYLAHRPLPTVEIAQASHFYDVHGDLMARTMLTQNRQPVSLDRISDHLVAATIAIEDQRFYQHLGIDPYGLARAAWTNVLAGDKRQGASTITQQLARNLYLSHERTWSRKLKEAIYALQLEMKYSKDDIMALYLNQIYYGHGAYGVEAAAQMYFGKSALELDVAESALLAGIPKGPTYYSPYNNLTKSVERQHTILDVMAREQVLTDASASAAREQPLHLQPLDSVREQSLDTGYFRDFVVNEAVKLLGIDRSAVLEGGLRIFTTLDLRMQKVARDVVREQFGEASRADARQEVAIVSVDPRNGYIRMMLGGRDYTKSQVNRTLSTNRQPGSSFKPVVYWAALHAGAITPATTFVSEPTAFTYDGGTYAPRNYNDKYAGGAIDLRRALSASDNIYAVQTMMRVTPPAVIAAARMLGMHSTKMMPVPSLALGTSPVSPLEMAAAFSAFASGGVLHEPRSIVRIEANDGRVLFERSDALESSRAKQVMSPAEAYLMTTLLQGVFERGGTAYRVASTLKRPIAGKTGTTKADAWLVGYTPELATAVWTGYDRGQTLSVEEAHKAAPLFANIMEGALAHIPPKPFIRPAEGLVEVFIDPESGFVADKQCPTKKVMLFLEGTEPKEHCPLHGGSLFDETKIDTHLDHWWMSIKRWLSE